MGRNLFIRVSAVTYDEKAVATDWPKLYQIAWPDDGPAVYRAPGKGVLEFVDALSDMVNFGSLEKDMVTKLAPEVQKLAALRAQLDDVLGDQDIVSAKALVTKIEDELDVAERVIR